MPKVKWVLDPTNSQITFTVRYPLTTNITGFIKRFTLEAQIEENDFDNISNICFTADASSIHTKNETREKHLKVSDFLDANNYSLIAFEGVQYTRVANMGILTGRLTIKETQKIITVSLEFQGSDVEDGNKRAAFTVKGQISRKAFGLNWPEDYDPRINLLDDEVYFEGNIQLTKSI